MSNSIDGDLVVSGSIRAGSLAIPALSVGNTEVKSTDPIADAKLFHRHNVVYSTDRGAAVVAKRQIRHICKAVGNILGLDITMGVKNTGTTSFVKVGVRKNGTTITSVPAEHNPGHSNFGLGAAGMFSVATFIAGDVLEFDITIAAGDGAVGEELFVSMPVSELPS